MGALGPKAAETVIVCDRAEAADLALRVGVGPDFLLLLLNNDLSLLDIWKLPSGPQPGSGFPFATAVQLAVRCRATGVILIQDRRPDNPVAPSPDIELTAALRRALAETGVELLDHLLLTGEGYRTIAGPIVERAWRA